MSTIKTLSLNGYIIFNKSIMQRLGIHEALMIGELVQEYNYWDYNNGLKDGWFYSTIENVQSATGLTRYQQDKAIQNLIQCGIIEMQNKGMPSKRHFKINQQKLSQFVRN